MEQEQEEPATKRRMTERRRESGGAQSERTIETEEQAEADGRLLVRFSLVLCSLLSSPSLCLFSPPALPLVSSRVVSSSLLPFPLPFCPSSSHLSLSFSCPSPPLPSDEPTSGLDAFTAHSIISLLRDLAHSQSKTIVCTIHQPSSDIFHFFDDLCLLADGQVMYHGPANQVVPYFRRRKLDCPDNFNPADFLFTTVLYSMDEQLKMISRDMELSSSHGDGKSSGESTAMVLSDREAASKAQYEQMQQDEADRLQNLLTEWKASEECATVEQTLAHPLRTSLPDPSILRAERAGEWYAFQLLSKRRWWDLLRDRMKVRVQFFQYIFFSLLLGLIFLRVGLNQNNVQDRMGGLFFVSVQAMFMVRHTESEPPPPAEPCAPRIG